MTKGFKKKLRFIGIGLAGSLVIIYLVTQFWISYRLNPFIDELIKNGVINSSDSLYSISYQDLTFSISTGTLTLKDVDLQAGTGLFAKRKANGVHVPLGLLNIHLNELKITGIEFYEAWMNKNLEAGNVVFENPMITFTLYDTLARRDTLEKLPVTFDLYKLFSEQFHSLTIQNIIVEDAAFRLFKNATDTTATVSSNGIQIEVDKLKIDSAYSANRYEIDLASKIRIDIAEAHWILPDSIYRIQFSNMNLDAVNKSLSFQKIEMLPLVDKYKIYKITGYEDDVIKMTIDSISFLKLDLNLLLYNHNIVCGRVQAENFNLNDFRYKGAPSRHGYKPFPMEQLKTAPLLVCIDSVILKHGRVEYAEQVPGNSFPGTVLLSNLTGSILNICNDSAYLKENHFCTVMAEGRMMDQCKVNVKAVFDQTSAVEAFTFEGVLGPMDMKALNPMILQSANVELDKGTLDAVTFKMEGDNYSASGNMTLLYHDLSVAFTKNEVDENGTMQKVAHNNFKSFLASALALVSGNPNYNVTRHATLYQKRDPEKSMFNFFWQTLLTGVKETMLTSRMKRAMNK